MEETHTVFSTLCKWSFIKHTDLYYLPSHERLPNKNNWVFHVFKTQFQNVVWAFWQLLVQLNHIQREIRLFFFLFFSLTFFGGAYYYHLPGLSGLFLTLRLFNPYTNCFLPSPHRSIIQRNKRSGFFTCTETSYKHLPTFSKVTLSFLEVSS